MATAGFNVSDELKQRIDKAAEQFVSDNGGSKGDFLTAMLAAWETSAARLALPGRADDIDTFEGHMAAMKASYMQSLYIAKTAREQADVAVKAEIQKAQSKQAEMVATINDLKEKLKDAEANIKATEARAAKEIADNAKAFNTQREEFKEIEAKAKEVDTAKAQVEKLTTELAATKSEMEQLKGRYKEKMELAMAKAETERKQAVIDATDKIKQAKDAVIDGLRNKIEALQAERKADLDAYASKIKELGLNTAKGEK